MQMPLCYRGGIENNHKKDSIMRPLIAAVCVAAALSGCAVIIAPNDDVRVVGPWTSSNAIQGNGTVGMESRTASAAPALEVSGPFHVDVRVGGSQQLEIEGDTNLLPMVRTESNGSTLRIFIEGNVNPRNTLRVRYTAPALNKVVSSGSGAMTVSNLSGGAFSISSTGSRNVQLSGKVERLDVSLTGSGSVNASALASSGANLNLVGSGRVTLGPVNGDALTANLRGSGDLAATGTVKSLNARLHGSGDANFSGLTSDIADLVSSGSGDITANVKQSVVASAQGSGKITVYGNPAQRNTSGRHVQVL
jgi:hypothetical protein